MIQVIIEKGENSLLGDIDRIQNIIEKGEI